MVARCGVFQVGDIFQNFTADGEVSNIINLSVPVLLQPASAGGGVTLRVGATYNVKGPRTIALSFQEVKASTCNQA